MECFRPCDVPNNLIHFKQENQSELKKMSLSLKEIEDGEDEMSEDKDNGSRHEVMMYGAQ